MQPSYSPYAARKKEWLRTNGEKGETPEWKKVLRRALFILLLLFLLFYLWLGDLRFFINHYFRLTFFAKNYLILLQNNYEARPGGGFITAYGNLDTFLGVPTNLSFHNSYEIDTNRYVPPPYPQEELLKNEWYQGYTFRDANWEPDFPASAEALIRFYQEKFPEKEVDGITVVNFSLIEKMVDAFGGIEINGKILTSHNLFSEIEFMVNNIDRHDEETLASRKNVLGDLAAKLTDKMKWNPLKTKRILVEGLKNKDLYFWLKSEGLEKRVKKRGWGNALELADQSDFLAVNLANLGAKKADRYLLRNVHHYVNLSRDVPEITTEVTLRFPGQLNAFSDHYKGYLRVIIPNLATVKESPVDSREERVGDFNAIGTKIILPAGSKMTLSYTYTVPRTLLGDAEYRLRLIRQSGSETNYQVTVETPRDTMMESIDFETRENQAMFTGSLQTDRDLSLKILPDSTPPYPIEQVFENLNTIKIYWSEPIDAATGNDALNYVIWDNNKVNEESDEVKVTYAEVVDGNVSRLELAGVVRQNLEHYQIELKGIRDLAGNKITPEPKIITVVQRLKEGPVAGAAP